MNSNRSNRGARAPSNSASLNRCRETMVGLEYLIEIINVPDQRPSYFVCILCDIEMESHMQVKAHLVSVEHRVGFLQAHFPQSLKPALRLLQTKECVTYPTPWMVERVRFLCRDIEARHGRLQASVADYDGFHKNRDKWVNNIRAGFHFVENSAFPGFTKKDVDHQLSLLGVVEVDNSVRPSTSALPNNVPTGGPPTRPAATAIRTGTADQNRCYNCRHFGHSATSCPREKRPLNGCFHCFSTEHQYQRCPRRPEGGRFVSTVVAPKAASPHSVSDADLFPESTSWPTTDTALQLEEYCKRYTHMKNEIMDNQKKYQKDPQSHPLYPSEWNIFWEARSEEFEKAGKDPYEHDFTREWSLYWLERMQKLDKETIERRANKIRIDLKINKGPLSKDKEVPSKEVKRNTTVTNKGSSLKTSDIPNKLESNKRPSNLDVRADTKRIHVEPERDVRRLDLDLRLTLPRAIPDRDSNHHIEVANDRPGNGSRPAVPSGLDVSARQHVSHSDRNDRPRDIDQDRKARPTLKTETEIPKRKVGSSSGRSEHDDGLNRKRSLHKDRQTESRSDQNDRGRETGKDRQCAESRFAHSDRNNRDERKDRQGDTAKLSQKRDADPTSRHGGSHSDRSDRVRDGGLDRKDGLQKDVVRNVRPVDNGDSKSVPQNKTDSTANQNQSLFKPNVFTPIIDLVDEEVNFDLINPGTDVSHVLQDIEIHSALQSDVDLSEVPMEIDQAPPTVEIDGDNNSQDPVTVISVLRLLAAFEDLLGNSLGPRIVDLLSKAVALEKVRENLSDDLLVSEENNILLETVKEKMKGLLLTGSVEAFKVPAVRKVIAHVNKINQIIGMRVKARQKQAMADARQNLELAKVNEQNKKEAAAAEFRKEVHHQLSTSIALQGKLITPEQLDTLTNVYIQKHTANDTPYTFGLEMGSRFPDIPSDGSNYLPELKQRHSMMDPEFLLTPAGQSSNYYQDLKPNLSLEHDYKLQSAGQSSSNWTQEHKRPLLPLMRNPREDLRASIPIREEAPHSIPFDNDHHRYAHASDLDQRNREDSKDRQHSSFHSQRVVTMGVGSSQRPHELIRNEFNDNQRSPTFNHKISVDFDNNYHQQQFDDDYHHHRQQQQQSHFSEALEPNHRRRQLPFDHGEQVYSSHENDQRRYPPYEQDLQRQRREMRMQMHREIHEAKLIERHRQITARYNSNNGGHAGRHY